MPQKLKTITKILLLLSFVYLALGVSVHVSANHNDSSIFSGHDFYYLHVLQLWGSLVAAHGIALCAFLIVTKEIKLVAIFILFDLVLIMACLYGVRTRAIYNQKHFDQILAIRPA